MTAKKKTTKKKETNIETGNIDSNELTLIPGVIEVTNNKPILKIKIVDGNTKYLPSKKYDTDGAYDIRAHIKETNIPLSQSKMNQIGLTQEIRVIFHKDEFDGRRSIKILPGERVKIPTGIISEIPEGYCVKIYPRSGLSLKTGLTIVNAPAIIDSEYRGEWNVIVQNNGEKPIRIYDYDRIAQMQLEKVLDFDIEKVSRVDKNTDRGEGGLGSTGTE